MKKLHTIWISLMIVVTIQIMMMPCVIIPNYNRVRWWRRCYCPRYFSFILYRLIVTRRISTSSPFLLASMPRPFLSMKLGTSLWGDSCSRTFAQLGT